MGRRKIAVKNMRLGGKRIKDAIWRQAAANLLQGPEPTLNERKNGAPSKALVAEGLCAVDPVFRKKMAAECGRLAAAPLLAQVEKAGWKASEPAMDDGMPRLEDGSVDYVTALARFKEKCPPHLLLTEPERTALFKAAQDGITDPFERDRLMREAKKAAGIVDGPTAIMLCNICGQGPTTERPNKGGWYCSRHFTPAAAPTPTPAAFTFGNTPVDPIATLRYPSQPSYTPPRYAADVPPIDYSKTVVMVG